MENNLMNLQDIKTYEEFKIKMEVFLSYLDSPPRNTKQDQKKGILYIAISEIEIQLDTLFLGQWQTRNVQMVVVGNEFVVSLELGVLHPISGQWLWRAGVGACMIRQKKDAAVSDIDAKIKNTMEMDAPHAKAQAVKNAALSIGKFFGRDIRRKKEDVSHYQAKFTQSLAKLKNGTDTPQD